MIIYRTLSMVPKFLLSPLSLLTPLHTFTTQSHPPTPLHSPETLTQFQTLLTQNTQASLQRAAELMATLQLEVESNQERIRELEGKLETCPAGVRGMIEKLQVVMDNIRLQEEEIQAIEKRAEKEIADCKNFSVSSIAKQVLDVADSLTRCKKTSLDHHKDKDHEVVLAIQKADKQIKTVFERYGIKQFDPTGQQYDPNRQEALSTLPAPQEKLRNRVAGTMRTGYTIKGRLLRSAHVTVYQ